MVLELLIYAKSAIKKFRPIRGLHCGHVTFKGGFWLVEIFYCRCGIYEQYEYAKGRKSKVMGAKKVFKEWPISNTSGHFLPISFYTSLSTSSEVSEMVWQVPVGP